MRDDFSSSEIGSGSKNWTSTYFGSGSTAWNGTAHSFFGRRDDSTPTVPLANGEYYQSTDYWRVWCSASTIRGASVRYTDRLGSSLPKYWKHYDCKSEWSPTSHLKWGIANPYQTSPFMPTSVISRSANCALNKAHSSNWDVAQFLGELKETEAFLYGSLFTIVDGLQQFRRRDLRHLALFSPKTLRRVLRSRTRSARRARRSLRRNVPLAVANQYLAFQYGLIPMLNDCENALRTLTDGLSSKPVAIAKCTIVDDDFGLPGDSYLSGLLYEHSEGTAKRGVTTVIHYGLSSALVESIASMGLTSPYSLLWELFPLSFVIDWFLHIGGMFQALGGNVGLQFKEGYQTSWLNCDFVTSYYMYASLRSTATFLTSETASQTRYVVKSFHRVPLLTFPIAAPYWDPQLNTSKWASIAALIRARFR